MNIFLKKSLLFLIIGISIAWLLQYIIDIGLKKSDYSPDYKEWYELMNSKINADILIQGSSRAKEHISPKELEKQFKLTAYNLGMNGTAFPEQHYRFLEYLKHNRKPRYIIQAVDANFLIHSRNSDFAQFIPYLNQDFIDKFKGHSVFTEMDLYVPLYKYTHRAGAAVAGVLNVFDKNVKDNGTYKGYQSFDRHFDRKAFRKSLNKHATDLKLVVNDTVYREFIGFVNYCKKENIRLILVYTPILADYQNSFENSDATSSLFTDISKKYGLKYLDYSKDTLCRDTSLFSDSFHLNMKGARIFNQQLMSDLKSEIK
jgi:hypothetical protein